MFSRVRVIHVRPKNKFSQQNGIIRRLQLFSLMWTIGMIGGVIVWLLRKIGIVQVQGFEIGMFRSRKRGVVLYHRHPSMLETMIIPLLFFPWFLKNPFLIPISAPDKKNFYARWWWVPIRCISIPVERGVMRGELEALHSMRDALVERRLLVIAPEGGRTWKGKNFQELLPDGTVVLRERQELQDSKGKVDVGRPIIRRFSRGLSSLANIAEFVPIWVEVHRFKLRIVVGGALLFTDTFPKDDIIPCLENSLLKLVHAEG